MPNGRNIIVRLGTGRFGGPYDRPRLRRQWPVAIAVNRPETVRGLIRVLIHRLEAVRDQASLAAGNPSADTIHDARVASRRAAAVLGILEIGGILRHSDTHGIKKRLRKMRRRGGVVRDLDVFLQGLSTAMRPEEKRQLERWQLHITQRRAIAVRLFIKSALAVSADARLDQYSTQLSRMDAVVLGDALYAGIHGILRAASKKAKTHLKRAMRERSIPTAHRARIAVKRLRYLYELCDEAKIIAVRTLLARLRNFQSIAGDLNDCASAVRRLGELHTPATPGKPSDYAAVARLVKVRQSRIRRLTGRMLTAARFLLEGSRPKSRS